MYGVGSFGRAMDKLDALIDEQNNYSEQMREVETQTARYATDVRMANANLDTAINLYESASGKVDTLEGDLSTLTGTEVKSNASTNLLTTSTDEMKTSMEDLDTAFGEFKDGNYDGTINKLKTSANGAKTELSGFATNTGTAQEKVTKLRVASEKLGGVKVDLYDDELKTLGTAASTAATNANTLHTNMKKLVDMRKGEGGASGITKEVSDNLKNARDYAATLYTNLTNVKGISMTTFVSKLVEARNALYDAKVYAYNLYDNLNKASKYKLRKMDQYALNNAYVEYDPTFTYASGGWPSAGELFVAREAGPEMVGTINGSTAVATNGDIVAAVSQGVAQAVAGVMGSGSGDMNISIQVGEYELANAVVSALNAQTRRIGYSQLEGI
jgi:conjugal transfer/entry exclusion protein